MFTFQAFIFKYKLRMPDMTYPQKTTQTENNVEINHFF